MKTSKIIKIFIAIVLLISIETSVIAASTGVVNTDTVRVRAKATTDSEIVELVSIGDKVTITGEEGNWYQVKVGKVTGYIRKDLLTVDGKVTEETPTENNNTQATPAENDNNTTETPTTGENANTNKEVPEGETGAETPSENTNIEKKDTTISTIKSVAGLSAGKKVQLTEETKIKILPSANSNNIAKLQANTEVTVLEVINSWCRIETTEGACGWVRIDQ